MNQLQAFLNDPKVKTKYLKRVRKHIELDEIAKGVYYEKNNGKIRACGVGCTIHGSDHSKYETELGIPTWLALLEDTIFEGLPSERAKSWPAEFLSEIHIGSDLETIKTPFIIFILENCLESMDACVFDKDKNPEVVKAIAGSRGAIEEIIKLHRENIARSAESAAESAAWSAAESAAESAARSAESAARSAQSARSAAHVKYADKLLALIRECK